MIEIYHNFCNKFGAAFTLLKINPKVSDSHNFHIQSGVVKRLVPKNDSHGPKFRVILVYVAVLWVIYEVHMDAFGVCVLITSQVR